MGRDPPPQKNVSQRGPELTFPKVKNDAGASVIQHLEVGVERCVLALNYGARAVRIRMTAPVAVVTRLDCGRDAVI